MMNGSRLSTNVLKREVQKALHHPLRVKRGRYIEGSMFMTGSLSFSLQSCPQIGGGTLQVVETVKEHVPQVFLAAL